MIHPSEDEKRLDEIAGFKACDITERGFNFLLDLASDGLKWRKAVAAKDENVILKARIAELEDQLAHWRLLNDGAYG